MAINVSTQGVEIARYVGAVYGLVLDDATVVSIENVMNAVGGTPTADVDAVVNSAYAADFSTATNASVATTVATNLGLTGTLLSQAQAYILAQLNAASAGTQGQTIMNILNMFGQLTSDPVWGAAATAWETKVSAAVTYGQNANNTSNSQMSAMSSVAPGITYTLTTGIDTITAPGNNNVVNGAANSNVGGVTTVTPLDSITFTGVGNTLNLTDTGSAASLNLADLKVSGVQTLNLGSNTGLLGGAVNVSGFTGLTQATFSLGNPGVNQAITAADTTNVSLTEANVAATTITTTGGADVAVTINGATVGSTTTVGGGPLLMPAGSPPLGATVGSTTTVGGGALNVVTVTGGGNVTINNGSATGINNGLGTTLTSVTLNGNTGTADLISTKSTTLGLTLENLKTNLATVTVGDTALKTLNLTTSAVGYNSAGVVLAAVPIVSNGSATSVNINATGKTNLELATAAATSLAVSGTGAVVIDPVSTFGALTAINASANSGGVTMTDAAATAVLTGGSGNDVITLGTALTTGASINLGTGNNTLLAGAGSIGTGVVVDGGVGGTNAISATLVNAGDAANVKDFQVLDVSGFGAGAGNGALDASLMSTVVSGVSISSAGTAGTATLLNLGANVTVTDSADNTSSSLVLTHAAGAGTLAINFASSAATTAGPTTISSLTSTGDTAVTISSLGTDTTTPAANALVNLVETNNTLTTVTITGANPFTLGGVHTDSTLAAGTATVASSLTTIDASATTGGVMITAGGPDAVNGNTITYTGLTIKGGTGGDTITNNAANGVITEGATGSTSVNTDTVSGSGASINDAASAGTDALTLSGANDSATLGSGTGVTTTVSTNAATSDIVTVTLGTGTATVTDNLLYASAAGNQTASTTYDLVSLGGTLHANTLAFAAAIATAPGALGAATSVASAQTFDQAVFVALGGTMGGAPSTTTTHAVNTVDWFQYAGNTYIVDAGSVAPGVGAAVNAQVVKIAGVVDLSHATIHAAGTGITFA